LDKCYDILSKLSRFKVFVNEFPQLVSRQLSS